MKSELKIGDCIFSVNLEDGFVNDRNETIHFISIRKVKFSKDGKSKPRNQIVTISHAQKDEVFAFLVKALSEK